MNLIIRRIKNYFKISFKILKIDLKNDKENTKFAFKDIKDNLTNFDKKSFSWDLITSNVLKLLAIIFMIIGHFGNVISKDYVWMEYFGKAAFPIFVFLLVVGIHLTSSKFKYVIRFLFLAVAFQIVLFIYPFIFEEFASKNFYPFKFNIYFQLFFGALAIYFYEKNYKEGVFVIFVILSLLIVAEIFNGQNITFFSKGKTEFSLDYGIYGFSLIMACYFVKTITFNMTGSQRNNWMYFKVGYIFVLMLITLIFISLTRLIGDSFAFLPINVKTTQIFVIIATPFILIYSPKKIYRIRYMRWMIIAGYPLSIIIPGLFF